MGRPRALVLLLALLTLCITAGTPEVWVQVQMEATKPLSLTVRCGFLGSDTISLVTAHWETRTSVSLTLEGSEERSLGPNTTFCCKFTSFPEGSQEACGNLLVTEQGLPAPASAPILRADLAGIWGISGVLLFGCVYLLHLLHRQRHWSVTKLQPALSSPPTQTQATAGSQASLASLHIPYATISTNHLCQAAMDTVLPPQPLSRWEPIPNHPAQHPAPWAPLPASARSSFISVENGLYVQAGERPPHICSNLIPFPDPLGPRAMEGRLGI
ncbi:transmembrane protein PVRIG isoform X2 [Myotis daubentonii]|uniref:transmembrane protein PVRIG isoform X2 n=1 Tax=Myotis daubentonii TaxID=98922 RepID=UPI002873559B|nr:transmembrane protein PVRIG isoform X2 [Myotis daubentonii]